MDHCQRSCQSTFFLPVSVHASFILQNLRVVGTPFYCEGWFPRLMTDSVPLDTGTLLTLLEDLKQNLLGWVELTNSSVAFTSTAKEWMKHHSQFCDLRSLPGVLPPAAKTLRLFSRSCFVATHIGDLQQCKPACEAAPTVPLGWGRSAHAASQTVPGSQQLCFQRAPAFTAYTNVKGFCGPLYLPKLMWAGEPMFLQLLPASGIVVPSPDCRIKMNTSHSIYRLLYFPGQTVPAESMEDG